MSARGRVFLVTALAAALAATAAVAVGARQGQRPGNVGEAAPPTVRDGRPPLALDLGVRVDAEAQALRRAESSYAAGRVDEARVLFDAHDSLEARVGSLVARWPVGTVDRLAELAGLHPRSAVVLLHLGLAQFWSGTAGSEDAWRSAVEAQPDTRYAVIAGNLLYPAFARDLPIFVTDAPLPDGFDGMAPPAQLRALERAARTSVGGKLRYGAALQRLGRQRSAEKVFRAAAIEAPADAEAQTAAAVGLFDKAVPAKAFSRLGPLTRRFPRAATVRFHLGLLLLWSGSVAEAKRQLQLAQAAEPGSAIAREAGRYLESLERAGS